MIGDNLSFINKMNNHIMAKLDFLDISYESYRNYHCGIPSTEKEKGLPFIVFTKIAIA